MYFWIQPYILIYFDSLQTLTQTDREILLGDWNIQGIYTTQVLHLFPLYTIVQKAK